MRPEDEGFDPRDATLGPGEHGSAAPGSRSNGSNTHDASAATARSAAIPPRLGRYAVLGELGRGGMSVVHEARDEQVGRMVALKLLHAELGQRHAERLVREARALAKLSHPNVVQVYEVGRDRDRWFIAMELVPGRTLREWQKDGPSWRECVRTYLQAGRGLAAAHAAGIVHRDFKPGNCILDDRGRVRVLDFGLAREAADASVDPIASAPSPSPDEPVGGSLTRTGEVLGTLGYMPLEQLAGRRTDARSDQWSFCASLYEALYGERPVAADSIGSLTLALMRDEVRPPPKGTKVPRRLRRVLLRGLARDPAARWPSMDALLAALASIEGGRRARWALAAGGTLAAGLGAGLPLWSDPAAPRAAPVDARGSAGPVQDDGRPPSPAAVELREHAEELYAARQVAALRDHLERIAPGGSLPDEPSLAAEVLLWRGRLTRNPEEGATLLRRAHALARDADVPSIEARAAGAMTQNQVGAHTEGVDEWLRLAWAAAERVPWDRSAAIEVAVTAAHSTALTWFVAHDRDHARALLEFADAVVGTLEPEDDTFVAMQLVDLALAWRAIEELPRTLHWGRETHALLSAVADATHPLWADAHEEIGRALRPEGSDHYCEEAVVHLDEALVGYLAVGDGERASLVRIPLASCLQRQGQLEAALAQTRAAAEHWAHHPPEFLTSQQTAHLRSGHVLAELGRTEEARAEYERVIALVDLEASTQLQRDQAKAALEALGPPKPGSPRVTDR